MSLGRGSQEEVGEVRTEVGLPQFVLRYARCGLNQGARKTCSP